MKQMLTIAEAQKLVLSKVEKLGTEELGLLEAVGRVLAEEIYAGDSMPPFNRSAMDGYAVRSIDTWNRRLTALKLIEELPAGRVAAKSLEQDTCTLLMTGAPLPEGADAVIRREDVEREGDLAFVPGQIAAGTNVDRAGSDIKAGEILLHPGMIIGPGEAALLASQGFARANVFRKPRVAILSTGDELVEIQEPLVPGKIRNSNRYMLAAALVENGADPLIYPAMPDELQKTKEMLLKAGEEADLVLSTGGVSMGDYDLVRKALIEIADEALFWRVQIKPGMPVVAVMRQNKLYLGLSGKPTGALLNFYLLAAGVISKLSGKENHYFESINAVLQNDYAKASPDRHRYLWAETNYKGEWMTEHIGGRQLKSLLGFNSLIEIPGGSGPLKPGDNVRVILVR